MKTTTQLTLLALLTAAASANAATVTLVDGGGARVDWEDVANWDEPVGTPATVLPDINDDVVLAANRRFILDRAAANITINSLTDLAGGFSSQMKKGDITVATDVTLNQGLVVSGGSTLTYGGLMDADSLEIVNGTHATSRVIGNNFTVAGLLDFRWFTVGTVGSAVPTIDLSGALTLGTTVEISLEGGTFKDTDIAEGSYFLVGSETITGLLPSTLDLSNGWTADQAAFSYLSIDTTNANASLQGLYLNVSSIPEPGTYALLAGCFALASVMIRRRR